MRVLRACVEEGCAGEGRDGTGLRRAVECMALLLERSDAVWLTMVVGWCSRPAGQCACAAVCERVGHVRGAAGVRAGWCVECVRPRCGLGGVLSCGCARTHQAPPGRQLPYACLCADKQCEGAEPSCQALCMRLRTMTRPGLMPGLPRGVYKHSVCWCDCGNHDDAVVPPVQGPTCMTGWAGLGPAG